ncbi:hypothetical protein DFS34DRAFT_609168 [Phlyctochytrium arcticum]|nr:hypothetical protein DFS34DRAFT_609168 [Phlyctochytrium arcticum]
MRLLVLLAFLASAVATVFAAIHADQAGLNDWRKELIGFPKQTYFRRISQRPYLVVETEHNVLALLNPKSGNVVWRQVFETNDDIKTSAMDPSGHTILTASGADELHIRTWDTQTGGLVWDTVLPKVDNPVNNILAVFEKDHVLLLVDGKRLLCLKPSDGAIIWSTVMDKGANYSAIRLAKRSIVVAGISEKSDQVVLAEVELASGVLSKDYKPPNGLVGKNRELFLATWKDNVYALWNGADRAYRHLVGSANDVDEVEEVFGLNNAEILSVLDSNTGDSLLVLSQGGKRVLASNEPRVLHQFSLLRHDSRSLMSHTNAADTTYVVQISQGISSDQWILETYDVAKAVSSKEAQISISHEIYGHPTHLSVDVAPKKDGSQGIRAFIGMLDGSVHLFRDEASLWSRYEYLAHSPVAAFVDLPEQHLLSQANDELDESLERTSSLGVLDRYRRRVALQLKRLQSLPLLLSRLANSGGSVAKQGVSLRTDAMGIRKLIVFASPTGKIAAFDSANGGLIWEAFYPELSISFTEVVRDTVVKFPPVLAVVGHNRKTNNGVSVLYLNAITGSAAGEDLPPKQSFDEIYKVIVLPVTEPEWRTSVLGLVGKDHTFKLSPSTESASGAFANIQQNFRLYLGEDKGSSELQGFRLEETKAGNFALKLSWNFSLPLGETIAASKGPSHSTVTASIGRVLGNRSVLFKYLNPNLLTIASVKSCDDSEECTDSSSTVSIYLIDAVTGNVLHTSKYEGAGHVAPNIHSIDVTQNENWIVASFWNHGTNVSEVATSEDDKPNRKRSSRRRKEAVKPPPSGRGFMMVTMELYENAQPDHRLDSSKFSSFNSVRPAVLAQSYSIPNRPTVLGTTKTTYGITTTELLVGFSDGQLFGVNRRFLDPRRPVGNPTSDDKEEGLIKYRPGLELMTYESAGYGNYLGTIENVRSSPTKLESTSIVVSWGLDVLCVRRAPSKTFDVLSEDFNYVALLATLAILVSGIVVSKRMAERKKLRDLWT